MQLSVSVARLVAGHWESIPPAPIATRGGGSVVWTGKELLVWGGASDGNPQLLYADGAAYNPRTRAWRRLPTAPLAAREYQASAWTGTELVIWGGYVSDGGSVTNDGAAYNPATNRWRKLPTAPLKAGANAFAVWSGNRVIVFGYGYQNPDAVAYEPATDRWRHLPQAHRSEGRNGRLVRGGANQRSPAARLVALEHDDADRAQQ